MVLWMVWLHTIWHIFINNIYFPNCTSHASYMRPTLTAYNRCLYHRLAPTMIAQAWSQHPIGTCQVLPSKLLKVDKFHCIRLVNLMTYFNIHLTYMYDTYQKKVQWYTYYLPTRSILVKDSSNTQNTTNKYF